MLDALRNINSAADRDAAVKGFKTFLDNFGIEWILIGHFVNPYNMPPAQRLFVTDWPDALIQHRLKTDALLEDPVAKAAMKTSETFRWSQAYESADEEGRAIMDQARAYDINEGIMIPMHAAGSVSGGVSLGARKLDLSRQNMESIEIVSRQAYLKLVSLAAPFPSQKPAILSGREIQVIRYVASGKSSWDIGALLGVKEDTVNKTMKRAAQKLGAVNRPQAVAKAIAQRLIFP